MDKKYNIPKIAGTNDFILHHEKNKKHHKLKNNKN